LSGGWSAFRASVAALFHGHGSMSDHFHSPWSVNAAQ